MIETTEYQGHPDPHVWFDVELWSRLVMPVAERLAEIDPDNAVEYRSNAEAYVAGFGHFAGRLLRC